MGFFNNLLEMRRDEVAQRCLEIVEAPVEEVPSTRQEKCLRLRTRAQSGKPGAHGRGRYHLIRFTLNQ